MDRQALLKIPDPIIEETKKHFSPLVVQEAVRFLQMSRVSISFSKGSPETFFIVSGIVKDDRSHETKVVYKKRLEGTEEGPLSSNCDCHKWNEKEHCPHAVAVFITYHIHLYHESQFDGIESGMSHPPIPLDNTFAVSALEYGTIVSAPHQLERAPSNSTYSSLQYLLHTKKIINFPIPENFKGKLIIQITSNEHFNEVTNEYENLPIIRFKYRDEQDKVVREISVFENLYLFNWTNGTAFHLPSELKDFIQKIRIYSTSLKVNDLVKLAMSNEQKFTEVIIDEQNLEDIVHVEPNCRVHLTKSKKNNQIKFSIVFHDENEMLLPPQSFLSEFVFNGGILNSFKKKQNAYEFIEALGDSLAQKYDSFKKTLVNSNKKNYISNSIDHLINEPHSLMYDGHAQKITRYKNDQILSLIEAMIGCFGSNFWRFSSYHIDEKEIVFTIQPGTLFQGLTQFYTKVQLLGIQLFYNRAEVASWSNRVRFERKTSSTKWFDLELSINDIDLSVIKNADLESGIALTTQGMVMLSKEQKSLVKFLKKYTEHESQGNYQLQEGDSQADEANPEVVNKFILPFNRARIFELFELKKLGIEGALTEEEIALCERLANLEEVPTYDLPEKFNGILRNYQKTGYNWLRFLYENKLGACLADDMGLGKTLQTITFLDSILDNVEKVLIVCPVTILLNWESEFKKFSNTPVHIYHGGDRTLPKDKKIILTSYGVMKREVEDTFSKINFDIFILDEVQHLKNIRSQGAYAARKIQSEFRICLTGTPVENDLAEFYNILDLSIPGIWGDLQLVRTTSNKKSRLLARNTARPFILRRTKSQVLIDLPPKIENNVVLGFSENENQQYKTNLQLIKKRIEQSTSKRKYGEILKGLLELRQNCLWQNTKKETMFPKAGINSTKVEFLVETLESILEEGHQAIIFSQFTTYLDYIQTILREKHLKLARIDGSQSIKKRQEQVELFQSGKCPVFLISLKAGGVGLNLTAASYVFIMDPWWNPAVEQQAIDRAHRIGQQNTLNVYRPIIKNSVEEKVLQLQEIKKELFRDLLPEDEDEMFSGKLSMRDFEHLLSDD